MQRPPSDEKSKIDWLDLDLPIPEVSLPSLPKLPMETVFALCQQLVSTIDHDDAYFARSLAGKNPNPFVL